MRTALAQMIEALQLEAAAIRKKGGGTHLDLHGGERTGQAESSWLYRFLVPDDLYLRDDTPIRVTCGQEDVGGVLVSFRDGVLVVALEKDLGPRIAAAQLVADDAFLIERLKESLEKVQGGEVQHQKASAERALGLAEPRVGDVEPHPAVLRDGRANPDQVRAVKRSLGSDTTFIWGPPGTGKTTTVARIVEAYYRAGRSVLLVSNTNIAVDTALERVAERLEGEPDFHQGLVIRQGPVVKEELRRLEQGQPVPQLVALGTQYRMREPICALVNELFYADHPLTTDPCVERGSGGFPLSSNPLLYVDTAPFHPWTALRTGTYSRYNLFHALLVRNIVLHLAETGFLPPATEPNDAVGAVAPYTAQARLIQALLDERLGPRAAGIAATVHRFQGNEKRAMILDLTDSIGAPLGRFLQATRLQEDGARLLNVAASRARHHVILVGNFEYLRAKAPREALVRRLVDHFEEHGEALDLAALLPLGEQDWIDGLHQVRPLTFDLPEGAARAFTEATFYPAFLKDLERARESVVILSPFATGRGTGRWADPLRAALARGVRVRIVTRPPGQFGGGSNDEVEELVQALRNLGVTVDLRAQMHEKIAIVDGRILWHGSLNILSHQDTAESMLRIESPEACRQLARFLSAPSGLRGEEPAPEAPENPPCPLCGGPTVWNRGRQGIWFTCEDPDCDGKVDPRRRGGSRRSGRGGQRGAGGARKRKGSREATGRPCPEPGCDGRLVQRNGRYGPFLGCTNYPACRHTEDVD